MALFPSPYWAWKRRRRLMLVVASLALLVAVAGGDNLAALEPAYDCVNGRGHDPVISISLNGGPNEWTLSILKVLRDANALATFFVEPELFISSDTLQQTLKQIMVDGHTVACHASGSHDNDQCRKQLVDIIGYNPVLRRPLSLDGITNEVSDARANGQVVALWNYDFGDWDNGRTEVDLLAQYRQILAFARNRTSDTGVGIAKRAGSFIIVLQNGDRAVRSFTMPNGKQTTILAEILTDSRPYEFVSMAECLKVKAYSAYSTPNQSAPSKTATSNTVLFAIVFAGLFGLLAIAAVLYTSARRKLHQKARQKEEQRELSRAAIGVMVSQGLFKGDRRDFEQSIPEDSDDHQTDAQRLRHLMPNGIVRTPPTRRTKKDFHDLNSSHYSMAVNPHGRLRKTKKQQPPRIIYSGQGRSVPPANGPDRSRPDVTGRRVAARRNSDPLFGSEQEEEVFSVEVIATRPGLIHDDYLDGNTTVYRPPVRASPALLPFQQPFDYGIGLERHRKPARPTRSGSTLMGSGTFGRRKRRSEDGDDDDDLDADFRQDFIQKASQSPYI